MLALAMVGAAAVPAVQSMEAAQSGRAPAIKVGILPCVDATGSGNRSAGADVGRTMQAEMVHSTNLLPSATAACKRLAERRR